MAGRQPQGQVAEVADQPAGDGDQPPRKVAIMALPPRSPCPARMSSPAVMEVTRPPTRPWRRRVTSRASASAPRRPCPGWTRPVRRDRPGTRRSPGPASSSTAGPLVWVQSTAAPGPQVAAAWAESHATWRSAAAAAARSASRRSRRRCTHHAQRGRLPGEVPAFGAHRRPAEARARSGITTRARRGGSGAVAPVMGAHHQVNGRARSGAAPQAGRRRTGRLAAAAPGPIQPRRRVR